MVMKMTQAAKLISPIALAHVKCVVVIIEVIVVGDVMLPGCHNYIAARLVTKHLAVFNEGTGGVAILEPITSHWLFTNALTIIYPTHRFFSTKLK